MSQPKIYENTFTGCTSLSSLKIPSDVVEVEDNAFLSCSSLRTITIPSSTLSVGNNSFKDCASLRSFTSDSNGLSAIGLSAFMNDKKLVSFSKLKYSTDPASGTKAQQALRTVGDYAFANTGFRQVDINLVPTVGESWWGDYCFASCDNLTDVSFFYSTYMANYMFDNCKKLRSVDYTQAYNVNNYVGRYVFNNCSSLSSVTFSDQQFSILKGFFQGCTSLKKVDFFEDPSGKLPAFKYVQSYAFANCSSLEEITFPASIESLDQLEDSCLSGCSSLKKITFKGGMTPEDLFPYATLLASARAYDKYIPTQIMYGSAWNVKTLAFYTDQFFEESWEDVYKQVNWLKLLFKVATIKQCPFVVMMDEMYYTYDSVDNPMVAHYVPANVNYNIESLLAKKKAIIVFIQEVYGDLQPDLRPPSPYLPSPYLRITSEKEYLAAKKAKMEKRKKAFDEQDFTYDPLVYAVSLGLLDKNVAFNDTKAKLVHGSFFMGSTFKKYFNAITTQSAYNTLMTTTYKSTFGEEWDDQDQKTQCIDLEEISESVLSSGFLRACHDFDVTFCNEWGSETATCRFKNDPSKVVSFVEKYEYPSDMSTLDNFKTARELHESGARSCWYYNSKEVYEYAKAHHVPVFFIYSKVTCTPCQAYGTNIHEDEAFQKWIEKQDFICCRMEAEKPKGLDRQMKWCDEVLGKNPRNYARDGHPLESFEEADFNAFGEIGQDTSVYGQHFFHGFYTGTQLQNPTFVFYYFKEGDVEGKETAYHGYSFHNIINIFNSIIGVQGMEQLLKSLCLWHFDNNSLEDARFVHDAGKAFVKEEYDIKIDNPYEVDERTITLNTWVELKSLEKTPENVLLAMKKILSRLTSESSLYPEYIGDCCWGDIEWVDMSFDQSVLQDNESTPAQINAELALKKIAIGSGFYLLQVDASDVKHASTPCNLGQPPLYRYKFVDAN